MKLLPQGKFEWIIENPIETDDIINPDCDVKQINNIVHISRLSSQ